ncbi:MULTISPECIES: RNA polymerase sigma factor [Pseudarthrobacter]|jgi:RNA polymerase sigma factor (sigma-70 family)|uniref:Sigma-70 family RNA polymerase sigma factor n=1 Tax=Pseudarthrobacter phenanthrenivorans TaxID=361575 RepID=A0A3B0FHQ2_PSEPS|nr:sigma-70 family RNA polymerase sigma factor [Pseudarthrobacter phenanthrenivorans]RKO19400.1 sigma-70 family RNA polymerase sigma factor [Pseudarthrobacter phenanthrenivorans]BFE46089.1 sigma-70 family RNA polymerase sigma factor [Pseudarthrobacter oxydans]
MGDIETTDDRLWSRSLQGEGDAFGLLFDRHRDRVFRHAYRLAGDRIDAEDIMSTAFLELWRRREKVRLVERSVLPWLLVTTTNVARNSRRAARRYQGLLKSLPRSEDARHASDIPDTVDRNVALALGTLNATDLRLVSLVVFEEFSLADAAAALGMTAGTAKTRMHRARNRMKAAINRAAGPVPAAAVEGERP